MEPPVTTKKCADPKVRNQCSRCTIRTSSSPDNCRTHSSIPSDSRRIHRFDRIAKTPGVLDEISTAGTGVDRAPRTSPSHDRDPLALRVEIVVIDGDEGQLLTARQAAVMRTVLTWIATHRSPDTGNPLTEEDA
jgi:hypothetical protein